MTLFEILAFFLTPVVAILEPHVKQFTNWLTSSALHRKIIKFVIGLGVLLLLIGVALVAYLSFYWIYIPQRGHAGQVHLQYDNPNNPGVLLATPTAWIDFSKGGKYSQFLRGDQAYNIAVNLHVPTSEKNVAIGNFMVKVEMFQANGEIVQQSSRPAILTYQSLPLRLMRTAWRTIPLVLEWSREEQTLWVPLIENFVESAGNPVTRARVTISTPDLQVYKSTIHIDARFHGLRYFMYYYKVSTALVFMLVFIFWELVFTVITWQVLAGWFGSDAESLAAAHRIGQIDAQTTLPGQPAQHQLRAPTYDDGSTAATTTSSRQQRLAAGSTLLPRQPQQGRGQGFEDESESDLDEDHHGLLSSSSKGGRQTRPYDDDEDDDEDEELLEQLVDRRTLRGHGGDDAVVPERPLSPSQHGTHAASSGQKQRTTTTTTATSRTGSGQLPQVSRSTVVETDDGASTSGSTTTTTASSRRTGRSGMDMSMTSQPPAPPPSVLSDRSSLPGAGVGGAGVGGAGAAAGGAGRSRRTAVESDFTEDDEELLQGVEDDDDDEHLGGHVSMDEDDFTEAALLNRSASVSGSRSAGQTTTTTRTTTRTGRSE
ncbi:putative adipose-regulatory protein-domain-containing protein [Mortierella sp. GBAus27b]|nr:putative adipose-regulatory protein-domain-containing protein [Mortierella sp. GBAus27b]